MNEILLLIRTAALTTSGFFEGVALKIYMNFWLSMNIRKG